MNTLKNLSDNELLEKIKEVKSIAGLLRALNLIAAGGNYDTVKKRLKLLNADISHWTGQGWNFGHQLKDFPDYITSYRLKIHLCDARGYKCEKCKLSKWLDKDIPLELNHIDGNKWNNNTNNLEILCPNCHAQTPNWRRKKSSLNT